MKRSQQLSATEKMKIRRKVYDLVGGRCEVCGTPAGWYWGHLHHIKHRSLGGDWSMSNLAWVCPDCHRKHHDGELRIGEETK